MDHECISPVLVLLQVGSHLITMGDVVIAQIRNLVGNYNFKTYSRAIAALR